MILTIERPAKARSLKPARRAPVRDVARDGEYDGAEYIAEQDKFRLRELPSCIRNRRPGQELTNAECIEAMQWMKDVLHDATSAARARAEEKSKSR